MVSLSRLETGWRVCRGLNVSDNALFGKEILVACPNRGAACGRSRGENRILVPGDACLRGNAFGYEPVRLSLAAKSCTL